MGRVVRTVGGNELHRRGRLLGACLVGLLMISGWGAAADAAPGDLKVQGSTRESIRFSLADLQAHWQPVNGDNAIWKGP